MFKSKILDKFMPKLEEILKKEKKICRPENEFGIKDRTIIMQN